MRHPLLHLGTAAPCSDRCTSVASSLSFEASAVTGSPDGKDGDPEDTKGDGVGSEDDNEISGRACEAGRRDDDARGRLSRSDHCDQGAAAPRRSVSRPTSTIVDDPMSMIRRVYAITRGGAGVEKDHSSFPSSQAISTPKHRTGVHTDANSTPLEGPRTPLQRPYSSGRSAAGGRAANRMFTHPTRKTVTLSTRHSHSHSSTFCTLHCTGIRVKFFQHADRPRASSLF